MEPRDGPVLTQRGRRALFFIEQELSRDERFEPALRTMRPRRLRRLPRRRGRSRGDRPGATGDADTGGGAPTVLPAARTREMMARATPGPPHTARPDRKEHGPMPSETWEHGETAEGRFAVTESVDPRESVLRLVGELDHDTAPALRAALGRCEQAGAGRILVDFSDLGFCDSTGLNLLLEARTRAQERGASLALVGMPPGVARVFEITGAGTLFPQYASVDEARGVH
ncbi:STAS domain-containing protein [Streptacidiphilus rugosus]|uniref:STAS domain-containing protein n=1 Tax=Streptacidiphilus rugosus TaxID=405783 RepID=UPI000AC4B708|nr:STAS domain-containing protein [Streptacidiphilus rugosus]